MKVLSFIGKLFLKIIFAPLWLLLTILIGIFSMFIGVAAWILCIVAIVLGIVGVFVMINETVKDGLLVLFIAYLLSPWGISMFVTWILSKFILFKDWLTAKVY